MLALSPPLFPTTHVWALEDLITQKLPQDCNEANSYNPILDFHTYDQFKHDISQEHSLSSGETANGGTGDEMVVVKKLNHNASERDRRKRVNELYGFLRSLLPISCDQKKKLSIPKTVSHVLKYIPELQKEVDTLRCKKEKMLSNSSIRTRSGEDTKMKTKSSVVSLVSSLGDKEAVIQLISPAEHMSKNRKINLLSKVLDYLEQEENELVLLNATTFKSSGEGMLFSTLHLQMQGDHKIEAEKLKEKLGAFHQ